MSVSVAMEFIPPDEPDLLALHIYEAATQDGPFSEIDNTQAIGSYPNWITRYTTANANSIYDWFAIAWENTANVVGEISAPMQGGSSSVVSEVVNRVLLRDPTLNPIIVGQEAEVAVCEYFGVLDPYSVDPATVTPQELSGLTYFTMARCYIVKATSAISVSAGSSNKWAAGIVSMDKGTTSVSSTQGIWDAIDKLIEAANKELGRSFDVVLLMKEIPPGGTGGRSCAGVLTGVDMTRSTIEMYALP